MVILEDSSKDGPGGCPLPPELPPKVPLPPGVYFRPTPIECVELLDRWISGEAIPEVEQAIFQADVYSDRPDVLRRMFPPANSRGGEHSWWFFGVSRFQCVGGGRSGRSTRAARQVATGGSWRLEQSKKKLPDDIGTKSSFAYCTTPKRKVRSPWLMEEYTSSLDDGTGDGKIGMPALYRVYVTPRASDDQIRAIYGEDAVSVLPDGTKKPARVKIPSVYIDRIAERLPPGSIRRRLGTEQNAPPPHKQFLEIKSPAGDLYQKDSFLEPTLSLPPGQFIQADQPLPPCSADGDFKGKLIQAASPRPPCYADCDFRGKLIQGKFIDGKFIRTVLPPPPCSAGGDLQGKLIQGKFIDGKFIRTVSPPPPCSADGDFRSQIIQAASPRPPCSADGDLQGQFIQVSSPLPPCSADGDFRSQIIQAASPRPPCFADGDLQDQFIQVTPLPGNVEEFEGQHCMEAGTHLPLPASDVDFDLGDINMWDFSAPPSDFAMEG